MFTSKASSGRMHFGLRKAIVNATILKKKKNFLRKSMADDWMIK